MSLIECMVAMVIMSLGALGISKLQLTLYARSDLAKQRTEATHLAQQKIEQLRASPSILLAAGSDVPTSTSNTSFARWWTLTTPPGSNAYSLTTVNVQWVERTGEAQFISLSSLIAHTDPADAALLRLQAQARAQALLASQNPARRHADVPAQATRRGDGTSALTVAGGVLIYDDSSGLVISFCAEIPPAAASAPITPPALACVPYPPPTPS